MHCESISPGHDLSTLSDLLQRRGREYADRAALVFHDSSAGPMPAAVAPSMVPPIKGRPRPEAGSLVTDALTEIDSRTGLDSVCWTFAELERRARRIGAWLSRHAEVGDRALLVYLPGLEFSAAFFGCLYAGILPVPATYPKPRRRLSRLANMALDCQPRLVLTSQATLETIALELQAPELRAIPWQATNALPPTATVDPWQPIARKPDDLAFLQYTSGSTTEPRGVMVTHRNLLHNLEMIRRGFGIPQAGTTDKIPTSVFWLPAYHDMGLIGGILSPLYVGGTSHLLAPATFLRRPLIWLELLSATQAEISGGPNFAYDLCVEKSRPPDRAGLDLSHWRLAFCGAEPIQADTLREFEEAFAPTGFRNDVFYPCYGLAEATLLVSGPRGAVRPQVLQVDRVSLTQGRIELADPAVEPARAGIQGAAHMGRQSLVGCGNSQDGQELRIVDPDTRQPKPDRQIGEIWLRGDSVTRGYWRQRELSQQVFAARLVDARHRSATHGAAHDSTTEFPAAAEDGETYMRTGDLGFQLEGELYVTGRLKDLLILRGRNHYPQDIERTARGSHQAVDQGAAFVVAPGKRVESVGQDAGKPAKTGRGGEAGLGLRRERLVVVHQVRREHRRDDMNEVLRAIRRAIVAEHELDPHAIVLIRPASLPVTSSGKVQRSRCRELYVHGELKIEAQWQQGSSLENSSPGISRQKEFRSLDKAACADSPTRHPDFTKLAHRSDPCQLGLMIEDWMLTWLAERANLERTELSSATPFAELGVDSMTAIELNQELEEALQLKIPPAAAWDYPTPATLSRYLATQFLAGRQKS